MPLPFLIPLLGAAASAIGTAATTVAAGAAATAATVGAAAATVGGAVAAGAAALGTAAVAAAPFIAGGAAILGGLAITGAIIEANEEAERNARRRAREAANREREKEAQKKAAAYAEKMKQLEGNHNISDERKKELLLESSRLKGELQGTIQGLRDKGMEPEQATLDLNKALAEMREKSGIAA